ncbi:MAG: type II secretion system protein GspD [Fimbriimonadales bacterium]
MRLSWAKLALGAVMATMIVGPVASAVAQQVPDQVRISVDMEGMDLLVAVRTLTKLAGMQFVQEPSDQPFGKVTLHLVDTPAEDVLQYMCKSSGAFFRRDENGVYILSHKKPEPEKINETAGPLPASPKVFKKIRLMKADPETVYNSIVFGASFEPTSPFAKLNNFRNVIDQAHSQGYFGNDKTLYEPKVAPPVTATSQPVGGRGFTNPNETANGIALPGEGAKQIGGGGLGGGGLGGGGLGGGGLGGGGLGGGQGGQVTLTPGQGLVPSGITFISYDPTDNSFIVEGSDDAIQEFIKIINEFDVAPRQVTIKVEFITTSSSVSRSLGFEFLYSRGTVFAGTTPGSFVRASDPIFLNYGNGNVTSRMRTQLLEGFGKVVNAPIIRTLNNQPAAILSSVQTTIFINQIVGTGGGTVIVSPQPVPLNISTGLIVAPRINGDGTITLALSPQIQDFGQLRRGPDGQEIPDVLAQQINVVARVKNDETIVLGGLTRKSDQGSEARVPILADLPIIGQFFRSTTRDRNNSELLIFVTPHIIEEDEGTGGG